MTVRCSEVLGASGGGLAIRPNSPEVLQRDDHGGVRVLASDGIASPLLGGTVPVAVAPAGDGDGCHRDRAGVRLVDFSSGSVLGTIDGPPATMLAFSGDGTRLAIESGVGNIARRRCGNAENRRSAGDTRLSCTYRVERHRDAARRRNPYSAGILDVATGETLGTPDSGDGTGWPSRAGSGTSPSSMWRPGEPIAPAVTLPFPAIDRIERDRDAARHRRLHRRRRSHRRRRHGQDARHAVVTPATRSISRSAATDR